MPSIPYGSGKRGGGTVAQSTTVSLATDSPALPTTNGAGRYETVAASQTAQVLGGTGATGDYLAGLLCIPATTSPGVVTLLDNATSIPLFVGGAASITTLHPFYIPINAYSISGAWKVTTGANISVVATGTFSA